MLGVFDRFTGKQKQPEELMLPLLKRPEWIRTCHDVRQFYVRLKADSDLTFYNLPNGNFMALSQKDDSQPRTVVVMDDIYCIFSGTLDSLHEQRVYYGLSRESTEALIVVAAYKLLRDRGTLPPDQVVKGFKGKYAFMLFDTKNSTVFLARDRIGRVDLHWGTAADGSLVCCDDSRIVVGACGNCYTPFPPGSFFLGGFGPMSYDNPYQMVKPIEHKDDKGRIVALEFQMDMYANVPSIPRNSSEDDQPLVASLEFNNWTLGPAIAINVNKNNQHQQQQEQQTQQTVNLEVGPTSKVNKEEHEQLKHKILVNWEFGTTSYNVNGNRKEMQLANWSLPSASNVINIDDDQ